MKNITILGSTGSLGVNTLKVIDSFPRWFNVVGLSAYKNVKLLARQIKRFRPACVAVKDDAKAEELLKLIGPGRVKVYTGQEGLVKLVTLNNIDLVIVTVVGSAGLLPTLEAIEAGKNVGTANKESLIMAGRLIMRRAKKKKALILPLDSEHNAIFQCLQGRKKNEIKRLILTGSGGPFKDKKENTLSLVTPEEALRHPRWRMGQKVTIDSASLMNKGLEVIEASCLFDVPPEKIDVLIHPEAIIHSLIEFIDGTMLALLGVTDMRLAIQFVLTYPERLKSTLPFLRLDKVKTLTFEPPDYKKFPALKLCYKAVKSGGTTPAVLNGANEEAVNLFLRKQIKFTEITDVVKKVVNAHKRIDNPRIKDILKADKWAREKTIKNYELGITN